MKKLLLLFIVFLLSCSKKDIPEPTYAEQQLKEWGLQDKKGFTFFGLGPNFKKSDNGMIALLGFHEKKLWVGLYDSASKKKIWEALSSERLDTSITRTEYGVSTESRISDGSFSSQVIGDAIIVDIDPSSNNMDPYFQKRHILFKQGFEKKIIPKRGALIRSYSVGFYEVYGGSHNRFGSTFSYFDKDWDSIYSITCENWGLLDYWVANGGSTSIDRAINGDIVPFLPKDDFLVPTYIMGGNDDKFKANFTIGNIKSDLRSNTPQGKYETKFTWNYDKDPDNKFVSSSFNYTDGNTLIITLNFVLKNNTQVSRRVQMNATTLEWKYLD